MDEAWSMDGKSIISFFQLCRDHIDNPGEPIDGVCRLEFSLESDPPIFSFFNGFFVRSGLTVEFSYTNQLYSVPMSVLAYEQNEYGALAWVMEGQLDTPYGCLRVKFPIRNGADGGYLMRDSEVSMEGLQGAKMEIIEVGASG